MNVLLATNSPPFEERIRRLLGPAYPVTSATPEPVPLADAHSSARDGILLVDGTGCPSDEVGAWLARAHRRLPCVVVVSAYGEETIRRCIAGGAQEVVSEADLDPDVLVRTLSLARIRYNREEHIHLALEQSQKMEALGRMTGGIAHDYNNLLNIIMNQAVLACDALDEHAPARNDLDEQLRVIKQASALTRHLLGLARRRPVETTDVDVCALVAGMKNLFRHITGKKIALDLRCTTGPLNVRGDAAQLEQVLINLIINACDAMTNTGTLTICVEPQSLAGDLENLYLGELVQDVDQPFAMISVKDSGHGIEEQDLEHIFEPFYTTKNHERGTGLGLYQVFSAVKQHRGLISVRGNPGSGAEFRLFFPRI